MVYIQRGSDQNLGFRGLCQHWHRVKRSKRGYFHGFRHSSGGRGHLHSVHLRPKRKPLAPDSIYFTSNNIRVFRLLSPTVKGILLPRGTEKWQSKSQEKIAKAWIRC